MLPRLPKSLPRAHFPAFRCAGREAPDVRLYAQATGRPALPAGKPEDRVIAWKHRIAARIPWLRGPYRMCRSLLVISVMRYPKAQGLFTHARTASSARFWRDWFEERDTDPRSLAEESFWQYYEELGLEKDDLRGLVVVDVGSGPRNSLGSFESALTRIGIEPAVVAADRILREKHATSVRDHSMIYIATTAEDTLLPNGFADLVLCVNGLDHLDRPIDALKEFARILKPEGRLLLSVHRGSGVSVYEPHPMSPQQVAQTLTEAGVFDFKMEVRTTRRPRPSAVKVPIAGASEKAPVIFVSALPNVH